MYKKPNSAAEMLFRVKSAKALYTDGIYYIGLNVHNKTISIP